MSAVHPAVAMENTLISVTSSDGSALRVRKGGQPAARPVLFLHGLGMDALVWQAQIERLRDSYHGAALDLRGHGGSDAPVDDSYGRSEQWADDLHAVLATFDRPAVLVPWSYSGMVAADYLRKYGSERVAGVYLVAPLRKIGTSEALELLDQAFMAQVAGLLSNDLGDAVAAAQAFVDLVTSQPLHETVRLERLGAALAVPAHVRAAMLGREQDNDDVWGDTDVRLGIAYGRQDRIVKPSSSAALADLAGVEQVDEHPEAGHGVFLENGEEFARNLDRFLDSC